MAPKMMYYLSIFIILVGMNSEFGAGLDGHYYEKTCPQAESIIYEVVRNATTFDPKVPARILRMFFHDCFIMGCDASVLVESTPNNKAEKDGPPNLSLGAFYVIDDAKTKLEKSCPKTVSCADTLAIAARDVVLLSGGPKWSVLTGRKDGKKSRANETINLPAPTSNTSQLIRSFGQRGLSTKDLVALSGGHTLGFSHCASFDGRLRNFSAAHDTDPTLDPQLATDLKRKCPKPNTDGSAGQFLDSTASIFDNDYYTRVVAGKGVFVSDQSLLGDYRTRWIVEAFARDQGLFFKEFADSMLRLGNVGVIENGEVRENCRVVN
ncbi:Peroxidase superfamily protein [Perilla frutescens var. hirtella]|uniref:Peroxidase n=1 Tax=Perilla frutescens var. hirtella TaxID=608512 RepID=A0AAD4J6N0_PERFH|nr:Peroxidase superfamily protein [Perilla frutescens var. hirtella]KAH6815543.1 Peroxidase superfamily protein [Perilla frutescens var. frutescens]KAH6828197.1 Peroxidase superfamily protein [Perilla frutescens var. hirtella]